MVKVKKYENGVTLVVKTMDGLFSVSAGILVKAGAANETDAEDGLSHFIEHMQFKGTDTKSSFELSDAFDRIGAQVNAFTEKDMTCYYAKCTSDHTGETFSLLADMFLHATYPDEEAQKEKGVVCEEIHMYEDTPDDLCFDVLYQAMYGNQGYGRTILGSEKNVQGFSREDIQKYKEKYYGAENIVISFAGGIDFALAEALTDKYFSHLKRSNYVVPERNTEFKPCVITKKKKIEQAHFAIALPAVKRDDLRVGAMQTLSGVLGGGTSSRLFQEVREKLGLAYSVYSYLSTYEDCGNLIVYTGVNPAKAMDALKAIGKCIGDLNKGGITEDEFMRCREQSKSALLFAQESTSAQMLLYGKEMLLSGKEYDFEKKLEQIGRQTLADVEEAMHTIFQSGKYAMGVVGNIDKNAKYTLDFPQFGKVK